jgi:hypothetical protein
MPVVSRFNVDRFIDRDEEQTLFETVLDTSSSRRLIAIRGEPGAGKSELLLRYQHRCRTSRPRIPVSLVELRPALDRLALVEHIATELRAPLPSFRRLRLAARSGDFDPFRAWIDLHEARFDGAQNVRIASTLVENADQVNVHAPSGKLTEGQERIVRELCVHAFFADLVELCHEQAVVLILDAYEKIEEQDEYTEEQAIVEWVHTELLERLFDEPDPLNLVVVLAGRAMPAFEANWPAEDVATRVERREKLGQWSRDHIEQCLAAHRYRYLPEHVTTFCEMVRMGATPGQLLQMMEVNHRELLRAER